MEITKEIINDRKITVYACNTAIVGSGAAGFNAALRLHEGGMDDFVLISEGRLSGTSRNTGSDKQTYYKMNLCADYPDSPAAMAKDLFAGRCVDGDIAYAEAAGSVRSFLHLAELGVPFPVNSLGEYVGYKTDHDPRARATSAGPLTSKLMTESLEKRFFDEKLKLFDNFLIVSILRDSERICGLLALDLSKIGDPKSRFVLIRSANVIFATGGPAGMYQDSVYPMGHTGSSGIAFEAGVRGRNLTEWQYGLASVNPRWNVSGTYMQVLPRFVSIDSEGKEHEFLHEYESDLSSCLSRIFKKGYEWPFDSRKAISGSSVIDLLVYRETKLLGRRVYLDYRSNPQGLEDLPYDSLAKEAKDYLTSAGACFGRPIDRLLHMNAPAYELYLSKGLDLKKEMLEIALCAQHNNGGLDIDMWWQTNLLGFFACGEVAGSHGVYRPGGSALNAGQVGSMRAAQYILEYGKDSNVPVRVFEEAAAKALSLHEKICTSVLSNESNVMRLLMEARIRMSRVGGAIRSKELIDGAKEEIEKEIVTFTDRVRISDPSDLYYVYKLRDTLISQSVYLSAMSDYIERGGLSRGSSLYTDPAGDCAPGLDDLFRFRPDDGRMDGVIQEVEYGRPTKISIRPVRPLPEGGGFFENVWRSYRQNHNINYHQEEIH